RLDLGQQLLDGIHHLDDVGAGLALDIDQDGGGVVGPAGQLVVLGARQDIGHVAQIDRGAVLVGHHDVLIGLCVLQLVIGVDGVGLHRAIEAALGRVGVVVGDGGAQVVYVQTHGRQLLQVRLDPDGRLVAAGNADQAD